MTNYHISPRTGRINKCYAEKRPCPIGSNDEHFKSKKDANDFLLKSISNSNEIFNTLKKNQVVEPFIRNAPPRYHVCRKRDLSSIVENGLIPQIGVNSKEFGETIDGVYLFTNLESLNDAGWLEDCFDDDEELVVLEVTGVKSNDEEFYETIARGIISPNRLKITNIAV